MGVCLSGVQIWCLEVEYRHSCVLFVFYMKEEILSIGFYGD